MADYLIRKQTGYNTCCPDEENTVGYYAVKEPDNVEVYTRHSLLGFKIEVKCRE